MITSTLPLYHQVLHWCFKVQLFHLDQKCCSCHCHCWKISPNICYGIHYQPHHYLHIHHFSLHIHHNHNPYYGGILFVTFFQKRLSHCIWIYFRRILSDFKSTVPWNLIHSPIEGEISFPELEYTEEAITNFTEFWRRSDLVNLINQEKIFILFII